MITKASPVSANVSLDALAAKYHTTSDVLCADITKHNKRYGTTKIELYGNNTQVNSREEAQHPGIFYDREKKEFTLSEIAIYLGKDRKDIVSNIRDYNDPHRPNSKGEQLIPARFKRVGLNSDPVYHIDTIARYFYVFSKAGERDLSFQVMQNYVHALNLQLSKYAVQEQEKGSIVVSDDVSFDDDSSEGSKRTWTAVEKYASIDEQPGLTVNQITSSVGLRRYMVVHRLKRLGAKPLDEKLGPSYMYEKNIIAQVKNYVEPEKQTVPKKEMPTYASVDEQPGLTLEQMAGSLHLSLSVVAKRLNRLGADSLAQRLGRRSMYARDYLEQIRTYVEPVKEKQQVLEKSKYASVDEQPGLTIPQIMMEYGLSRSTIEKRLKLLNANPIEGKIGKAHMYSRDVVARVNRTSAYFAELSSLHADLSSLDSSKIVGSDDQIVDDKTRLKNSKPRIDEPTRLLLYTQLPLHPKPRVELPKYNMGDSLPGPSIMQIATALEINYQDAYTLIHKTKMKPIGRLKGKTTLLYDHGIIPLVKELLDKKRASQASSPSSLEQRLDED